MGETLKPCPFCGGNATFKPRSFKASCDRCGAYVPNGATSSDEAIAAWNTRTGDLIPRDEITPQMAAEVLLGDPASLLKLVEAFDREDSALIGEPNPHDRSMFPVDEEWVEDRLSCGRAALTAIKESKDER